MIRILAHPEAPLDRLIKEAVVKIRDQFGHEYSQAYDLLNLIRNAVTYSQAYNVRPSEVMERLGCETAAQVMAGAVYACLVSKEDFDTAMIVAVNHSGRSAAVGCLTGAILGARMGEEFLPDFYMDGLYVADVLRELADDLVHGCPMVRGSLLFDGDWESKYLHGEY